MSLEARSVILGEMLDRAGARLRAWNEARMEAIRARAETERGRLTDEGIHAPDEELVEHDGYARCELDGPWGDAGC